MDIKIETTCTITISFSEILHLLKEKGVLTESSVLLETVSFCHGDPYTDGPGASPDSLKLVVRTIK